MNIKTIVFDFGNVIGFFDHAIASRRLASYADMPAEQLHALLFDNSLDDELECGRMSTADFLKLIRNKVHFQCGDDMLIEGFADIFSANPDVTALLPSLHGRYRLLVGSNTCEIHSRQYCRQFAEDLRYFDGLVLSHEVGVRKPKAAFFEQCQRLAQCPPDECLFIDDLPTNIAGARACGWHGIVYQGNLRPRLAEFGVAVNGSPETGGGGR